MTTFCLNYVLIRRIGTIGINAYSVISYVASFAVAVFFGTAEGLLFVIGESVCRLFGIDGETLLYTVQVMRFYSVGYIAVAVTTIVSAYLYEKMHFFPLGGRF